jgi:hypothetical protein
MTPPAVTPTRSPLDSSADSPTESSASETLIEAFMKAIAGDPRFQPAKKTGKAFVIAGPTKPKPPSPRGA